MRLGCTKQKLGAAMAGAALAWAAGTAHAGQTLAIGEHAVLPGGSVAVPVEMADVAHVATTAFIVNYDNELLRLVNVATGGLGSAFALEYKIEAGRVLVALVRDDALAGGSGTLAYLHFEVTVGAVPGMVARLAIADSGSSGQHAIDFSWTQTAAHTNGGVRVVSYLEDYDGDGLPDWWEELYFEGPTKANAAADSDSDGMSNLQEYFAGTNPRDAASQLRIHAIAHSRDETRIAFDSVSGKTYQVQSSDNLVDWQAFSTDIPGTGGTIILPLEADPATSARFYRLKIVQ